MEYTFEQSPWDLTLNTLKPGDKLSAVRCLALLEEMSEEEAEEALLALEEQGIALDVSELPKDNGAGEAALRLRREQQLSESGQLLEGFEENDPLRLYLEELAAMPAAGDIEQLAQQYADGDDGVSQLLANLSLSQVVERACGMTGRGVLLMDLIQEGSLGLWQGILNYTGGDFETHIRWWVDQYLSKTVFLQARSSGIGEKIRQGMKDYRDADQQLLAELGRNPTLEEITEAIHVTVEEAATYAAMLNQARARQQVEQLRKPKEETPEDTQAVENTAYFQTRQRILDMLSTLTEQEAKLLTLRFGLEGGLPMDSQQAGQALGLTPDEVVKIETAALSKLRQQKQ